MEKRGIKDYGACEVECAFCGKKKTIRKSMRGRSRRNYCNTVCYRHYMAERFDRWIASPETIALPQNYDEFLTQEILPCLVEGCGWEGKFLSAHMNFEHGVPAEEFKKAAGFNLKTGVVTPDLSDKMREQALARGVTLIPPEPRGATLGAKRPYSSLEGSEHRQKAYALALISNTPSGKFLECKACGKPVGQPYRTQKLYCSVKCRSLFYAQHGKHDLVCGLCQIEFKGSKSQKRSTDKDNPVYCSYYCRGKANTRMTKA